MSEVQTLPEKVKFSEMKIGDEFVDDFRRHFKKVGELECEWLVEGGGSYTVSSATAETSFLKVTKTK